MHTGSKLEQRAIISDITNTIIHNLICLRLYLTISLILVYITDKKILYCVYSMYIPDTAKSASVMFGSKSHSQNILQSRVSKIAKAKVMLLPSLTVDEFYFL